MTAEKKSSIIPASFFSISDVRATAQRWQRRDGSRHHLLFKLFRRSDESKD